MSEAFNEQGLVYSENYAKTMNEIVLPFLQARGQELFISGAHAHAIAAFRCDAEAPRGTVVILHGFTESAVKFSEIMYSLLQNGYSVLTCDQRGHGVSWRDERIKDSSLTHVDHFEDYVEDLKALTDQALQGMPKPWFLFAHSMGGAVSLRFLEQHPGVFSRAALCAPMVAPQRGGLPLWVGKAICINAKILRRGQKRIPMSRPFSGPEEFETSCATGRERFQWYDEIRVREETLHNNGPTFSWTLEAFQITEKLLAPGEPEKVQVPVKIWTAADDNQVIPEAQAQMAARLPEGQREIVPGAKHEIYRSSDAVLFPWWRDVLDFLQA